MVIVGTPRRLFKSDGTQEQSPIKFIAHKKFSRVNLKHDIAIVRLKGQLVLSQYVQPVTLVTSRPGPGMDCTVTGWGMVYSVSYINANR